MDQLNKPGGASVAWYKLADLIARREREKALNVYRLLSHSFDDKAYALQLEGDILASLNDGPQAHQKYQQAAFCTKKRPRWINAICVCEHLLMRTGDDAELIGILLDLYAKVSWQESFNKLLKELAAKSCAGAVNHDKVYYALEALVEADKAREYGNVSHWVTAAIQGCIHRMPEALNERLKRL